jgi:hypothetical protein
MWLSDSYTKFLIKLTNSSNDWSILSWFYIIRLHLFIDIEQEWSLCITLILKGRFLLGQVANHLNIILTYLGRCLHHFILEVVLLLGYIPLIFSLCHFLIFFLPSWARIMFLFLKKESILLLLFQRLRQTLYIKKSCSLAFYFAEHNKEKLCSWSLSSIFLDFDIE